MDGTQFSAPIFTLVARLHRRFHEMPEALRRLPSIEDASVKTAALRRAVACRILDHRGWKHMHTFPVLFVGVRSPLDLAEQRERHRGDRTRGLVRAHYNLVHAHGLYDLELDTAIASPMQCALRLKAALDGGHPRQDFAQLERSR